MVEFQNSSKGTSSWQPGSTKAAFEFLMSFWALKIYSWVCVESLPTDLENEVAENRQGTHLSFVPSAFFFFFFFFFFGQKF